MLKYSSTTTKNSRRSSPSSRWRRRFVVFAAATIVLGLLLPQLYSAAGATVLWPVRQLTTWVGESSASLPQYLRSRAALLTEIEELERARAGTAGIEQSLARLEDENARLRALLGDQAPERLLARVLKRPPTLLYDHLQIDRGSADGVVIGAPVYTGVDAVVGTVVHTGSHYAFVELVTTPGFQAGAYVLGPNVFATLEGVGGGVARVRLPQGIDLAKGQLVLLPGVESGVYGEVVAIESLPTQPEQYGYVAPAVPLQSIRYVTVGTAPPPERSVPEIEAAVQEAARSSFQISSTTREAVPNVIESTGTSSATSSARE